MADTYTTEELIDSIGAHNNWHELQTRVADFLGHDWKYRGGQKIAVTMPKHCTRIDTETSYSWAE